jgi:hypothetical protein
MIPEGVRYADIWVATTLGRCFQLTEADDRRALEAWADEWRDLVDFEFVEVTTSDAARAKATGRG